MYSFQNATGSSTFEASVCCTCEGVVTETAYDATHESTQVWIEPTEAAADAGEEPREWCDGTNVLYYKAPRHERTAGKYDRYSLSSSADSRLYFEPRPIDSIRCFMQR